MVRVVEIVKRYIGGIMGEIGGARRVDMKEEIENVERLEKSYWGVTADVYERLEKAAARAESDVGDGSSREEINDLIRYYTLETIISLVDIYISRARFRHEIDKLENKGNVGYTLTGFRITFEDSSGSICEIDAIKYIDKLIVSTPTQSRADSLLEFRVSYPPSRHYQWVRCNYVSVERLQKIEDCLLDIQFSDITVHEC